MLVFNPKTCLNIKLASMSTRGQGGGREFFGDGVWICLVGVWKWKMKQEKRDIIDVKYFFILVIIFINIKLIFLPQLNYKQYKNFSVLFW